MRKARQLPVAGRATHELLAYLQPPSAAGPKHCRRLAQECQPTQEAEAAFATVDAEIR